MGICERKTIIDSSEVQGFPEALGQRSTAMEAGRLQGLGAQASWAGVQRLPLPSSGALSVEGTSSHLFTLGLLRKCVSGRSCLAIELQYEYHDKSSQLI